MPSAAHPTRFAFSPASSPNRAPPGHTFQGPTPVPNQMSSSHTRGGDPPHIGGYTQGAQQNQVQQHEGWNGANSPFSDNAPSLGQWQQKGTISTAEQHSIQGNMRQHQMPQHRLGLAPGISEQPLHFEQSSMNNLPGLETRAPEQYGKASSPPPRQLHRDQQINGSSQTSDWIHHSNKDSFQTAS